MAPYFNWDLRIDLLITLHALANAFMNLSAVAMERETYFTTVRLVA
jgi:hypothetical protein